MSPHRLELVGPFRLERRVLSRVQSGYRSAEGEWRLDEMTRLYGSGATLTDIARRFGVSRQRIAELLDRAEVR